jgi:excisionase family DNA binding protein
MSDTAPTELLDLENAAERLSITTRHLRQLVADRKLRHYKVGGRLRFDRADLDAFLISGRREPIEAGR